MFGSFRLGRIVGIEISINYSLFLIGAFVVWQMSIILPANDPTSTRAEHLIYGVISALVFFASILWHELAHALVAKFYNVRVRRIVLFFLGGVAEIEQEPRTPAQEFWIAFVGPLSSLLIAGIFWVMRMPFAENSPPNAMFYWLALINAILAAFNMLPGFPLDGGRVLRAVLWGITGNHLLGTKVVSYLGQGVAVLMLIGGFAGLFLPINLGSPFWNIFLGWFFYTSSKAHLHEAIRRDTLRGVPIGQLVHGGIPLKAEWSLAYAVDIITMGGPLAAMPVMHEDKLVGGFSMDLLRALPRVGWGSLRVEHIMQPLTAIRHVDANMDIYEALNDSQLNTQPMLLVVNQHAPLGLITLRELVMFAERRLRQVV